MKNRLIKLISLIYLYFSIVFLWMTSGDFEAIITMTAAIPLIVYMFNKDPKVTRVLKYILYIFSVVLAVYAIAIFIRDYRWSEFLKYIPYDGGFGIIESNFVSIQALQYLVYIGIIFLVIKNNKNSI